MSEPKPVSPLIRSARWGLFIAGIFYARAKQKIYSGLASYEREQAKIRKALKDKEMAGMRERLAREEIESLEEIMGIRKK